jgi:peptidyl-prolyl cis-trans isomerase C
MRRPRWQRFGLGLALAAACARPADVGPTVATFGADAIRMAEFKAELDRVRAEVAPRGDEAGQEAAPSGDDLKVMRRAVLDQLVNRHLLLAEAARAGTAVTEDELDGALQSRRALAVDPASPASPEALEAVRRRTREDLVIDRFLVKRVAERVALSPEEARAWYETHPERFPKVEQVRCQQITAATREALDVLRLDLQQGADFTKLAREKSMSEDKVRAGDLGWFAKGQMLPEFEEACFALKKGQVSPVVTTAYGFHLLRLIDRREGPKPSYAAVQDAVDLELRRERVGKAQAEFIQKLREQADVQINDAALDKVP